LRRLINYLFFSLGAVLPFSVFLTDLIILSIVLLWILQQRFSFFTKLINNKWFLSILVLNILYALGCFWGGVEKDSWYVIKSNLLFFCIPIFFTIGINKKFCFYSFLAFCSSMFVSSFYGILEHYDIIPHYFFRIYKNPDLVLLLNYRDHNIFLSFCIIISFVILFRNIKIKNKTTLNYIIFSFIIFFIFSLFIERGRMGQLNFILMAFFISFLFMKTKHFLITVFSLIFLVFINYNINNTFKNRINSTVDNINLIKSNLKTQENQRWYFLTTSIDLIKKKPFFGYGTGSFATEFSNHSDFSESLIELGHKTPHNHYLYVMFELGFLGLIFFLFALYYQFFFYIKRKDLISIFCCFLPFLFMCLGDSYLVSHNTLILFLYFSFLINKLNISSFYSFR